MTARQQSVRREVLRRDGRRCVRCGSCVGLQVHHVMALADAGADSAANCVVLCRRCHREWHEGEGFLQGRWAQFLATPCQHVLASAWVAGCFDRGVISAVAEFARGGAGFAATTRAGEGSG